MKSLSVTLGVILVIGISIFAHAQEPDGFLGMKWRASIDAFRGKSLFSDFIGSETGKSYGDVAYHAFPRFGEINPVFMQCHFYNNKFYHILIAFHYSDSSILEKALLSKYGTPTKISPLLNVYNAEIGVRKFWKLKTVSVTFETNKFQEQVILLYSYLPIVNEILRDDKKGVNKVKDAL